MMGGETVMKDAFRAVGAAYSQGERFDEMRVYTDRKLKIWEEETVALFPARAEILDIGCGKGREAFCLDERGFRVTGIDVSGAVIEAAREIAARHHLDIRFAPSDGMELAFPDASFDVVIIWAQTFGLFHADADRQHILRECGRMLREGGFLSFSGHDRDFLEDSYAQYLDGDYFCPFGDSGLRYSIFTVDELTACAEGAGFHVLDCRKGLVYTEEDGTILHCACRK